MLWRLLFATSATSVIKSPSPVTFLSRLSSPAAATDSFHIGKVKNTSCCQLAFEQSYCFFDDIPDALWIKVYQEPSQRNNNNEKKVGLALQSQDHAKEVAANHDPNFFFSIYDPWFPCPSLVRLGGLGDGPKYTCDPHRFKRISSSSHEHHPCLVYSFVNGDRDSFRWEEALADLLQGKCEIYIFDWKQTTKQNHQQQPMPLGYINDRKRRRENKNVIEEKEEEDLDWLSLWQQKGIRYFPWSLVDNDSSVGSTHDTAGSMPLTFQQIQNRLGHDTSRTIDIVKIDCDGCEWKTWRQWIKADIRQLLIKTYGTQLSSSTSSRNHHRNHHLLNNRVTDQQQTSDKKPTSAEILFFEALRSQGFELFSKETDTRNNNARGRNIDWSWIKLSPDFRRLSP